MKISHTICSVMLALMTAGWLVSCSDGFLEEYPDNKVPEGNFYRNDNDFNQAVRGCYARVKSCQGFHLNELAYRSDEGKLTAMNVSTQNRYDLDHFQPMANNGILSTQWDNMYNGIYRCNDVLDHLEGRQLENRNRYRGEALFIRAWFYFTLYRVFGTVPLACTVVSADEAKHIPRCTDEEMLELLTTDLREAAGLLPDKPDAEVARVTSMAALTLLAKVHLTFGQPDEARTVLDMAMTNPNFGMETSTARVFNVANKMNREMIFALYYNKSNDNGHGYWFGSSKGVLSEIEAPSMEFRTLYADGDNRKPLINEYVHMGNLYVMRKWYDEYDAVYTTSVGNDFPHLRYADVVLMYAEALAATDVPAALAWLNVTRRRAGLADLTSAEVPDRDTFIKELAAERGREFALEGQRWFDLVRLGLAVEHFSAMGYDIDECDLLMPIPHDQIELVNDRNILWQNPGYY